MTAFVSRQPDRTRRALLSTMRDEGPFILEWVSWHLSIGFSDIVVCSNDCSDGTERLLEALARCGVIRHVAVTPGPKAYPPRIAYAAARRLPEIAEADWVMVLDADEFLVVHVGDGTVRALTDSIGDRALGMAVHWKCFGDSGRTHWQDGLVRHQFRRAASGADPANMRFKSIFREPLRFDAFAPHAPVGFRGDWGGRNIWINSAGQPLPGVRLTGTTHARATAESRIAHVRAQVNHYVMKSADLLPIRRARWAGLPVADRYDAEFVARYNVNTEEDLSATLREDAFQAVHSALWADAELRALHKDCCDRFAARIAALDTRRQEHLAMWEADREADPPTATIAAA